MTEAIGLIISLLSSNPSITLIFLVCFLVVFALPSVLHFLTLKELKKSIDRLDDRIDSIFKFIMDNLKIKDD